MKKVIDQGPYQGLSTRAAGALSWHYKDKLKISLSNMTSSQIKYQIRSDIANGKLVLGWIKNCGKKSALEISAWINNTPMDTETLVEAHMNKGADDKDPYWDLFKCKDAVNDAIVEAYKLGYRRGLEEGRK